MKYTINGFSQEKLISYGLDEKDSLLLRYFIDFKDSGKMKIKTIDEEQYYWVSYKGVMEAMPILNLKEDSVYRRLKKLCEKKILKSVTVRQGGVYSFYKTGDNYITLISDLNPIAQEVKKTISDENPKGSEINPTTSDENPNLSDTNPTFSDEKPEQNINLLYSSNNINLLDINIYSRVVERLNEKTGSNFRANNKKTRSLISARIKEGYNEDDFFKVIDNMCREWLQDVKMQKYLRPETLFGTKFEGYLNIKPVDSSKQQHRPDFNSGKKLRNDNFAARNYDYDALERKLLGWDDGDPHE